MVSRGHKDSQYEVRYWAGQVAGTEMSQDQEEGRFQQSGKLGSRNVVVDLAQKVSSSSKSETP